ncbi:LacI family transcriptional regulator [Brachybacterium alimentarium]|nr:LacI family transcriptional regulator [Brachybacterium alimentarium]RCS69775.1 LacI family transcriptional regulator [Brachybacterium alimentarium]RCS76310.1 LacI family transcriptional regulator [Brachybacterium alimentarium]RCS76596.1 LacI family transcriptional regulator [Brachybacterium alimentarium]RCS79695.1 LacI family transcriptional regulator [Brachybacterium alimentarium]
MRFNGGMSSDASASSDETIDHASEPDAVSPDDGTSGQMVENLDSTAEELADSGQQRGTLRDVADSLGISSTVALRALRGAEEVKPQMVTRVHETAERLHFPLEELSEEEDHRGVVAVLVNTMRNTWISDLVRAIRIELSATGRTAVVVPTRRRMPEYPVAADTDAIESLVQLGVDGFLMISDLADMDSVLTAIADRPLVGIGCSKEFVGRFDTVRIDDEVGQGLLVDHLVGLGHREIAHIGGVGAAVARERADAFRAAMERHGLGEHARVEPGDFTEQVGQTAGSMLLRGSKVPTAVTCANDVTAVGLLSAAREAGISVPEELAVAGYGNTSLASSGISQTTSVDPNSDRLGALAAQFLVERVSGLDTPARDVAVAPSIVVRRSSSAGPRPESTKRKRISVD